MKIEIASVLKLRGNPNVGKLFSQSQILYNQTIMTKWRISLITLILLLTACSPQAEPSDQAEVPSATLTSLPTTTDTPIPTSTTTPTETAVPTETEIPCFTLLEPADETTLNETEGKLTFAWTEQTGAASYRFAITIPSGFMEEKELAETSFQRWLESLPLGGAYSWVVTAIDRDGETICTAGPFVFNKPAYVAPTPTNSPAEGSGSDGQNQGGVVDSDGDGVPDTDDACPNLPGPPNLDGCPPGGGGQD